MSASVEQVAADEVLAAYLQALTAVDYDGAVQVLTEALHSGLRWDELVAGVIGPAQREVGRRWASGDIGVAEEHAATAISENVVSVLSPPSSTRGTPARVIMLCAEGEWHTFPLRLAASVAGRSHDLHVTMLGGSVPGEQMRRFVRDFQPAAVAVSASLSCHLIGAAGNIRAACEEGVPVVVGGSGWGGSQDRARRMGANLLVDDPRELPAAIRSLDGARPVSELPVIPEECMLLNSPPHALLELAYRRQVATSPWMQEMSPHQERETKKDLGWIARYAANAVACHDGSVLGDLLDWLLELLVPRGVPAQPILDAPRFLAEAVEPVAPLTAVVLREQADLAEARTAGGD